MIDTATLERLKAAGIDVEQFIVMHGCKPSNSNVLMISEFDFRIFTDSLIAHIEAMAGELEVARVMQSQVKYVSGVVNNNQSGHDVILRPRDAETIPVGTMMIACPHPDLSHDCCIWCGMNMVKPACKVFRPCTMNNGSWCADCGQSKYTHALPPTTNAKAEE